MDGVRGGEEGGKDGWSEGRGKDGWSEGRGGEGRANIKTTTATTS